MTSWVRYVSARHGRGFGQLGENSQIHVYDGDLFDSPKPTDTRVQLADVTLLSPCQPSKIVALWNNFHALAEKTGKPVPSHALFLIKPSTCLNGTRSAIKRPASYRGKIAFEGELGIVIGKACRGVSREAAAGHIFGYTCINDVTAFGLLNEDPNFAQWTRAKGFDTFGVVGPCIVPEFDWHSACVVTTLNGVERQNYPLADMVLEPEVLVSQLSQDMTLLPGDVIACGTSLGAGSMPDGAKVEVTIAGIGSLANTMNG
ncbi:MAG: DUF2437 domain-containing protein [Candidimonas sp.]|nr:MAG: DUF2437 domain-containing protein [Candidimonas sp.]